MPQTVSYDVLYSCSLMSSRQQTSTMEKWFDSFGDTSDSFMQLFGLSLMVYLCGWLGTKHQPTN